MRHKLKAVFDDRSKARQALEELLGSGYSNTDAVLVTVPGATSASAGEQPAPKWRERPGASTARLLSRFFDHADRDPVVAASRPGSPDSYILTLSTDSASEAQRAATLISGFMHSDSEDAGTTASGREPGIAHAGCHRAVAPGALQHYARDTRHYVGTRDSEDTSTIGTTFREPTLPAGQWPGTPSDGPAMQGVHTGPPVGDDAARAAYRFGHDLHENDRYRNRSWQEAHADLKVLWEASDPDRANWEISEPAVHLGWDSTRPEIDDDSYHRSHWRTGYASSATHGIPSDGPHADKASPVPDSWKRRHPGQLTAWENFMDALKHGWDRIRIGNDVDEADYRLHHANTYPGTNYDDLAPVYRYGRNVRRRTAFRNRSWDDVQDELRAEWERGHREGKPATWDEMQAALHQGWDHVKA